MPLQASTDSYVVHNNGRFTSPLPNGYSRASHSPAKYSPKNSLSSGASTGSSGHYSSLNHPASPANQPQAPQKLSSPSPQQYIPIPCTVKELPVSQAEVSHEIIRPTPRRIGLNGESPPSTSQTSRLKSISPVRGLPNQYNNGGTGHVVSVVGLPAATQSSYLPSYPEGGALIISNGGRKSSSNSPPSRATPVSRGQSVSSPPIPCNFRGDTNINGPNRLSSKSPTKHDMHPQEAPNLKAVHNTLHGMLPGLSDPPQTSSALTPGSQQRNFTVRLGSSPFWSGAGSRDPLSRQFEYPERDVPTTTSSVGGSATANHAQSKSSSTSVTAVTVHDNSYPVLNNSKSMHVTNLLIDKSPSNIFDNSSHNVNISVSGYEESNIDKLDDQEDAEGNIPDNDEEDSGAEEHPAVRQGRSSLIKYKANNKTKPKRKYINHIPSPINGANNARGEKLKRHEHLKHGVDLAPDKGDRPQARSKPTTKSNIGRASNGDISKSLNKANQLLEVKAALEQLSIANNTSIHSSTSTYSSMSDCDSEGFMQDDERIRKNRESSQETLSTTVTSADEFVWIDSHNRLVEVQQLPWNNEDFFKVVRNGTIRESASKISMEVIPRLSYYMQRVLVRVAREAQRLSQKVHKCSKYEVMSALRLVLSPQLASTSIKACLRAGAMYNISSDQTKQTKSSRAGLFLDIGKVHQWMCTVKIGKFIQEYAAVYMTAGLENILEEVLSFNLINSSEVTTSVLEHSIASNPELWGIFQPYAHLSSCRTSKGSLTVPKCINLAPSDTVRLTSTIKNVEKSMTQILLTTCVGSKEELEALVTAAAQFYHKYYQPITTNGGSGKQTPTWNKDSIHILYHFMRCSQLENQGCELNSPIQELVYERPYMVLPPLIEWIRVTTIFSESRFCLTVEKDDVFQAARILLPGADFPPRGQAFNNQFTSAPNSSADELEYVNNFKRATAFQMLLSGRRDLVPHALQMLPATKVNTPNQQGMSPLMVACLREDVSVVKVILETGASIDFRNPGNEKATEHSSPEQQYWTALHYATMTGNYDVVRLLLEKGANVEGCVELDEDICTETPLQLASASGKVEIVELLLSFGSSPFLSTLKVDSMSFGSSAQKGCYAALSTAASHGQRKCLHKLVTHPTTLTSQNSGKEVLSLEEILAEGISNGSSSDKEDKFQRGSDTKRNNKGNLYSRFTKPNVKKLQEAMYHSTENGNIEITLDLRNFGVPWTLHSWIRTLITAQQNGLANIVDELLQDFSKEWTEDNSAFFTDECLPVLFSIFRNNKSEGTTLFLADVLSACYGKDPIDKIIVSDHYNIDMKGNGGPRIDPKFVNNPELSDIQFRVEGQLFYAHKLVLITSSQKFRSMLNSKFCEGSPPILQINDIRYEIFEMVMKYLYNGSAEELSVEATDILELMAAANFFQLDGLLHFCEVRCASLIDLDTIVSYYIHAKVYSARQLLTYCEGFLLQNLVALLTYDDSVKRLIFGKKLQNHDVINGLLRTLQERLKKRPPNKSKKHSL